MSDDDKRMAAEAAVAEVADGMLIGLGTGSTAAHAIRALGRRLGDGLVIETVATSRASAELARSLGIIVHDFAQVTAVDLTIDGADEIDDRLFAIKGAGGAMLREKIVAVASRRMVVVADGSKRVTRIGAARVPVEILPFARAFAVDRLKALSAAVSLREAYLTDNGNLVADCAFPGMDEPRGLAAAIAAIPGVVGHGLFLDEVAAAYVASDGLVTRLERGGAKS